MGRYGADVVRRGFLGLHHHHVWGGWDGLERNVEALRLKAWFIQRSLVVEKDRLKDLNNL